jgi:DNA polymerase III epsilon subunit-like protein
VDSWVAIDFQTASTEATPIWLGAVSVRDGEVVDRREWLIHQPSEVFADMNVWLHHIHPEDVASAPSFARVYDELLDLVGDRPLVAHYAPFDIGVLRAAAHAEGLPWPQIRFVCSVTVSRRVWPGRTSYSLPYMAQAMGIVVAKDRIHDAAYDAELCAQITLRAINEAGADGLLDLLTRTHIRLGEVTQDYWHGATAKPFNRPSDVAPSNTEADPNGFFYGHEVCFTGALAIPRVDAWRLVADVGGVPAKGVTKHTRFLITGSQDMTKLAAGETHSSKLRRTKALCEAGQQIELLSEQDFFTQLSARRESR